MDISFKELLEWMISAIAFVGGVFLIFEFPLQEFLVMIVESWC